MPKKSDVVRILRKRDRSYPYRKIEETAQKFKRKLVWRKSFAEFEKAVKASRYVSGEERSRIIR